MEIIDIIEVKPGWEKRKKSEIEAIIALWKIGFTVEEISDIVIKDMRRYLKEKNKKKENNSSQ